MRDTIAFLFFLFIFCPVSKGQDGSARRDSLTVAVEVNVSGATNGALRTLWSYSQEWGRYSQYKQGEASAYTKIAYGWHNKADWFSVNAGVAVQASADRNLTMFHEAYVSGKIWEIGYTVGKEAYTPIDQKKDLGLGTYFMSDNARPTPRAGLGFFDYWAIPGLRNWMEIKGALYVGMLENEDDPSFTRNVMTHEKFAYLRIGHFAVKPYVGLLHSVFMGGTLADGTKVPIDFWASFFGRGSEKLRDAGFPGEYTNAAGGHQGMWDLGLDFDFEDVRGSVYYQRPFYDVHAANLFDFGRCKDIMVGAHAEFKGFRPLQGICLEYFTTMWQGGNGIPDPVFISQGPEQKGETIYIPMPNVTPGELKKYLGPQVKEWESSTGHPLVQEECVAFLEKYTMPEGWTFGDRSPYLQNGFLYPQGWTAGGLGMGYPVMLTSTTMQAIAPCNDFFERFSNIRLWALNLGIMGEIIPNLNYKFKFTFSDNYGNYNEEYFEKIDFYKKRPNYYFPETGLKEFYTGLWLDYHLRRFTFSTAFNYDFGQMYNCFSCRFGVRLDLNVF